VGTAVEMDSKGRLLIPVELREELGADEFILEKVEDGFLLKPIPRIDDPLEYARKIAIKDTRPVKEIKRWIRSELERR
jgi:bifunctional DNA-binding transcriptional regulator/antitoxin component of YhaV-PrlF toxin-antitoxin module